MKNIFNSKAAKFAIAFALIFSLSFILPTAVESYALNKDRLVAGGRTTGILLHSEGAVVTGFSSSSPAKNSGIKIGDIIISVDGNEITDKASLTKALSSSDDEDFDILVMRNGKKIEVEVIADFNSQKGDYSIGASVKDTIAGIGTITFIDPKTGEYGALGHGICDPSSGSLLSFSTGTLMPSSVVSVNKGKEGTPGELIGSYDMANVQGYVAKNTDTGIFGKLTDPQSFCGNESFKIAKPQEVREGKAYILSNVEGNEVKQYDIKIVDVNHKKGDNKQMVIEITDPELLSKTGGIVQGMSGSPIIQNGKLVGAVTHVCVNL